MLKIRSSISLRLKSVAVLLGILSVAGCGFRPLYTGAATENAISGQQAEQRTASVFIDEIADRIGQILHRSLSDRLTPLGEPEKPRYRLSVGVSNISTSQQAVRKDNLATRYLMAMTVRYVLYSYPENQRLTGGNFSQRSAYDVQRSPYATDVAEETTKERLAKIIGNDIALRVAAFLKGYKDPREEEKESEVSLEEELSASEAKQESDPSFAEQTLTEETAKAEETEENETPKTDETETIKEAEEPLKTQDNTPVSILSPTEVQEKETSEIVDSAEEP